MRDEFFGWRFHYLDPRVAMRTATPPQDVSDIGSVGEHLAPFLYRLRNTDEKRFKALQNTLKNVIPSVESLSVELDERRGTLDIFTRQYGREFSSRIVSEGTLRVLALCAISVSPWGGSLLGIEEPENGVHPSRIDLVATLVAMLASHSRQVVVTTHSPLFCESVIRECARHGKRFLMYKVFNKQGNTFAEKFVSDGPLFQKGQFEVGLRGEDDDINLTYLMRQGFI